MIGYLADKKRGAFVRSIACLLAASIVYGIAAPPLAEASLWNERRKSLEEMEARKVKSERPWDAVRPAEFSARRPGLEVPKGMGQLVDSHAAQTPSVIHVQDAHGYVESQKNLASLIGHFRESGSETPLLVCVEGAWGPVDAEWLHVFPEKAVLKSFADGLLARGEISGEEWVGIQEGSKFVDIQGIEDETVYWDNVAARDEIERARGTILEGERGGALHVRSILAALDRVGRSRFPSKLLEMDDRREAFARGDFAAGSYVLYLKSLVSAPAWAAAASPSLRSFADAAAMEAALDWTAVARERDSALKRLQEALDIGAAGRRQLKIPTG